MEIEDPRADPESWSRSEGWKVSTEFHGSPGRHGAEVPVAGRQRVGDVNQDAVVEISDVVVFLRLLFLGTQTELPCEGSLVAGGNLRLLDANADGGVSLTDAVYLLKYLFGGGSPPLLGAGCVRIEGCPDVCLR